MNPEKYKSVAMDIDHWKLAGELAKHISPGLKVSKKRVLEWALVQLGLSTGLILNEEPKQTKGTVEFKLAKNEVSIETLNKKELKHASNN
jgi:hypothetical protein